MSTSATMPITTPSLVSFLSQPSVFKGLESLARSRLIRCKEIGLIEQNTTTDLVETQAELSTTADDVFADANNFFGTSIKNRPPVFFAPDAVPFIRRRSAVRALKWTLPLVTGAAVLIDPILPTAFLGGGISLGAAFLKGQLDGLLESYVHKHFLETGHPASYDSKNRIILFYRKPSRPTAHLLLAHELTHAIQRAIVPMAHLLDSNGTRAFWEGHAISYEYLIARANEGQNDEYYLERLANETTLLGATYLMICEIKNKRPIRIFQDVRENMLSYTGQEHAIGFAAFQMAHKTYGDDIYRQALKGEFGFVSS